MAEGLAALHEGAITLFHVGVLPVNVRPDAPMDRSAGAGSVTPAELVREGALRRLAALAESSRRRGIEVTTVATTGDVADAILTAAVDLGADAIVLGTHGRTGLSHLLLGSVAERVVRHAAVPVVTVRSPAPDPEPLREELDVEDELAG